MNIDKYIDTIKQALESAVVIDALINSDHKFNYSTEELLLAGVNHGLITSREFVDQATCYSANFDYTPGWLQAAINHHASIMDVIPTESNK